MTDQLPVIAAAPPKLTDCDVSLMMRHELTDHRKRVGAMVKTMMHVGAYYETSTADVLEAAVLRDWMDRLQDWTPDAIRKAFWVWQDKHPNRRPGPAHILQILRETHGRKVLAERSAAPEAPQPPIDRADPEAVAAIMANFFPKAFPATKAE